MKKLQFLLMALAATGSSAARSAPDFTPFAGAGMVYSDNVTRAVSSKASATALNSQLGASLAIDTPSNYAYLRGGLNAVQFLSAPPGYRNEVFARLDGDWLMQLVPDVLSWSTADSYGQVAARSFQQIQPSNRENVNVLSTGPQASFGLGSRTSMDLAARYNNANYSRTNIDNQGMSAGAALAWRPSARQEWSLHAETRDINFRNNVTPDQKVQTYFGRWSTEARRTSLLLQAGATRARVASTSNTEPTYVARLGAEVGAYSRVQLETSRQYQDAGGRARLGSLSGTQLLYSGTDTLLVADPVVETRWSATMGTQRSRSFLGWSAYAINSDYRNASPLSRKLYGSSASVGFRLAERTDFEALLSYDQDKAVLSGARHSLLSAHVGLVHTVSSKLAIAAAVDNFRETLGATASEWRASVMVRYPSVERSGIDRVRERLQQDGSDFSRRPDSTRMRLNAPR